MPAAKRKLLIDAQLPPAFVRAIAQQGHPVEHVLDIGLLQASDDAIWQYAEASGAILITKDEDFAERSVRATESPLIVWLRVGNTTNRVLRAWIEPRLELLRRQHLRHSVMNRVHQFVRFRRDDSARFEVVAIW